MNISAGWAGQVLAMRGALHPSPGAVHAGSLQGVVAAAIAVCFTAYSRAGCWRQVARDKGRMPSQESMQRVVPLFETLSDLDGASATMRRLFSVPWYRHLIRCHAATTTLLSRRPSVRRDDGRG